MKNMKSSELELSTIATLGILFLLHSCNGCPSDGGDHESQEIGTPTIVVDTLVFDSISQTFSINLHTDSVGKANVTYFLFDGDSLLQENKDGVFNGINPHEEGYNIQIQVVWPDTTITTPMRRLTGFILPREPVEQIPLAELKALINSKDKSLKLGTNEHIAQNVSVSLEGGQPTSLQDVFLNLDNNVWSSVEITKVTFDDNNLVTSIELKPTVVPIDTTNIDPTLFDE